MKSRIKIATKGDIVLDKWWKQFAYIIGIVTIVYVVISFVLMLFLLLFFALRKYTALMSVNSTENLIFAFICFICIVGLIWLFIMFKRHSIKYIEHIEHKKDGSEIVTIKV